MMARHTPNVRIRRSHVPGPLNLPEMLAVGGGKLVWPEYRFDARWGQRVYSELNT